MARELDRNRGEPDACPFLGKLLVLVSAEMTEPPVMTPIRGTEYARNVPKRMWHRDPHASAGFEDACGVAERGSVVGHVLEDGDGDDRPEGAAREREPLCRAAHPQGPVDDTLVRREPSRARERLEREIAADRTSAGPRCLDHRVPGAADTDVDERGRTAVQDRRGAESPEVADAPLLELVAPIGGELCVEVLSLALVLGVPFEDALVDEDGDAVDQREAVRPADADEGRVARFQLVSALRTTKQLGQVGIWRTGRLEPPPAPPYRGPPSRLGSRRWQRRP